MTEGGLLIGSATENVFLDTEAFVDAGYNYESKRLVALRDLATQTRVRIFLTDVTVREIRAGLRDAIEQAAAVRPPSILRNSQLPEIRSRLASFDPVAVEKELAEQLSAFMVAAQITVLAVENDALPVVLDKYFDRRPPFGTGKNKAEFPDALAIEALLTWCSSHDAVMAVVSRDAGVQACCSDSGPLRGFPALSAFLDAVASENEALSSFVRDSLESIYDDIDGAALEALGEVGFYLLDEEGEVEGVEDVKVEWQDSAEIISLTPALATIEFPALFTLKVLGTYYDPGSGAYDRESGVHMFRDVIDATFPSSFERRVAVDIELRDGGLHVQSAAIEGSSLIGLQVHDPDPWD